MGFSSQMGTLASPQRRPSPRPCKLTSARNRLAMHPLYRQVPRVVLPGESQRHAHPQRFVPRSSPLCAGRLLLTDPTCPRSAVGFPGYLEGPRAHAGPGGAEQDCAHRPSPSSYRAVADLHMRREQQMTKNTEDLCQHIPKVCFVAFFGRSVRESELTSLSAAQAHLVRELGGSSEWKWTYPPIVPGENAPQQSVLVSSSSRRDGQLTRLLPSLRRDHEGRKVRPHSWASHSHRSRC